MRLICPSCGAQYEVDDGVIPDAGRDVQCSACNQIWFQHGAASPENAAEAPDAAVWPDDPSPVATEPVAPESPPPTTPTQVISARVAPAPDNAPPAAISAEDALSRTISTFVEEHEATPSSLPPSAPEAPRRALDGSLLAILREEAEREAKARRAEGVPIEVQQEMHLQPATSAAERAAQKLAAATAAPRPADPPAINPPVAEPPRAAPDFSDLSSPDAEDDDLGAEILAQQEEEERVADLADDAPRGRRDHKRGRERLPNIEEINSTLRASADRDGDAAAFDAPQVLAERRSGFQAGFLSVLFVAAIATAVYGFAPQIEVALPQSKPLLASYVARVNDGRIWLDVQLRAAIVALQPDAAAPPAKASK